MGQLPPPFFDAQTLLRIFGAKGFTSDELVALVGAHSAGRNHTGTPFDTTVGKLDSPTYYGETRDGFAPTSLPSDLSLALDPSTRDAWNEYSVSQAAWDQDYVGGYDLETCFPSAHSLNTYNLHCWTHAQMTNAFADGPS